MISPKVLTLPARQNKEDQSSSSPPYTQNSPNSISSSDSKPFLFLPRSKDNSNIHPKSPTSSESKMTNFSIAAIMNNASSKVGGDSGDLSGLTSISESGIALSNRIIHQQQLTSLREHAFFQLGRRGLDESNLSPLSKLASVGTQTRGISVHKTILSLSATLRNFSFYTCQSIIFLAKLIIFLHFDP